MAGHIITAERSIMVATDLEADQLGHLVDQTKDVEGISSYKLGLTISLSRLSLPGGVELVRSKTNKKIVYDHQKAGNDIHDMGKRFARSMEIAGVDAAIVFPFTGPMAREYWIKGLQDKGIGVLFGLEMTQPQFLRSEGGNIADDSLLESYDQAAELGVRDFVVPGNKIDRVKFYRQYFESSLGENEFTFYAPGFVDQGGNVTEAGQAAGRFFHAIVGRAIYEASDMHAAAEQQAQQLALAS